MCCVCVCGGGVGGYLPIQWIMQECANFPTCVLNVNCMQHQKSNQR